MLFCPGKRYQVSSQADYKPHEGRSEKALPLGFCSIEVLGSVRPRACLRLGFALSGSLFEIRNLSNNYGAMVYL